MRKHKDRLQRIRVVDAILNGYRSFASGARILGLCEQQMRNIVAKAARDGIDSVAVDGRENNRSSRSIPDSTREKIASLYRDKYTDFNFAHFSSMLRDIEHIGISDSSVGRILKEAGFRVPKARRRAAVHSRREPRAHAGELGQADASKHDWFQEGIDPDTGNPSYHHLYGIMDDATGRVSALWMEKEETTSGYWNLMRLANDSTGLYQSIYVDRRGTFRANNARRASKDPVAEDFSGTAVAETQFSRSMKDLDIDIVFACSGPAKGRIERLWLTLQDRLVKEFALNGIKDETAANAFFPAFLKRFNHEFQRKASDPEPFWKGRIRKDILDMEFCPHFKAVVSKSGSVAFRGGYLVLPARDSRGRLLKDYFSSSVEIVVRPDDDILMRLPDGKVVRPKILSKRPKPH